MHRSIYWVLSATTYAEMKRKGADAASVRARACVCVIWYFWHVANIWRKRKALFDLFEFQIPFIISSSFDMADIQYVADRCPCILTSMWAPGELEKKKATASQIYKYVCLLEHSTLFPYESHTIHTICYSLSAVWWRQHSRITFLISWDSQLDLILSQVGFSSTSTRLQHTQTDIFANVYEYSTTERRRRKNRLNQLSQPAFGLCCLCRTLRYCVLRKAHYMCPYMSAAYKLTVPWARADKVRQGIYCERIWTENGMSST